MTRALRVPVSGVVSDEARGTGYALLLGGEEEPILEVQVFPERDAVVLRSPVFTLEFTRVSEVRTRERRLRFAACYGTRRVRVALSRDGALDVRFRDLTPPDMPWEQGHLDWKHHDG